MRTTIAVAALALLTFGSARAQDGGFEQLQTAFAAGRAQLGAFQARPQIALPPQESSHAADLMLRAFQAQEFPAPDAATLRWLAQRVPGLDTSKVRLVPADVAEKVLQKAVAEKLTYLDVLSEVAFRQPTVFYAPMDMLNRVHRKYVTGLTPIQGVGEDGRPYQMQGFVGGAGVVHLLYDRTGFSLKVDKNRFKIDNGGRIQARILGAGDVAIEGLSAYGAPIFCPWARIQRMTKESMYKVRVETSCGTRGGNDIDPVRLR